MTCYTLQNSRVFPRRLIGGEIFNNRLLLMNNRLSFSLLFSGHYVGRQGLDGGGQSHGGKALNR